MAQQRKPTLRPSYGADATYLRRLAIAVEADTERPAAWRARIAARLRSLADEFPHGEETQIPKVPEA